jgi:hypothetical protein
VKSQRKETKNENKTKDEERPGQLMTAIQSDQYWPRSFFCKIETSEEITVLILRAGDK